ncbi:Putative F-box protein At1g53370 [Linum grandiflorum]
MKKTRARTASTTSSTNRLRYIPEDLIIDIQRRLRASCIPRFCCVSKSWNSLLSNPNFVYKSLFYGGINELDPNTQIVITTSKYNSSEYTCVSCDSLLPLGGQSFRKFPKKPPNSGSWIESCDGGFVCLVYADYTLGFASASFSLFNPATDEIKMLPPFPTPSMTYGCIGFSLLAKEEDDDDDQQYHYKVVSVRGCGGLGNKAYAFSSKDQSPGWREVLPPLDSRLIVWREHEIPQYGCTRKKKCYWIAYDGLNSSSLPHLVSFDPRTPAHRGVPREQNIYEQSLCDPLASVHAERGYVGGVQFRSRGVGVATVGAWRILVVIGMLKHGRVVFKVSGGTSLQILDVTTGQISSLPFEVLDPNFGCSAIYHLTTYVPSKMSLCNR